MRIIMAICMAALLAGCRSVQEIEWHENGQLKAVRYYKRGVTSIKMFCYDTDNHNQSQAVPRKEAE